MRRRAAIEPVIGHLKGRDGDRINPALAAAGHNFSLLLSWFEELLCALFLVLRRVPLAPRFI
jgi:transposase, IS5 family